MEQNPLAVHMTRWLLGILAQSQRDNATDVAMAPDANGGTAIRYEIGGAWHNWAPAPSFEWPVVVSELAGLAGLRDAPYPKEGIIYVAYSGDRLRWRLKMANQDKECVLHNLGKETI